MASLSNLLKHIKETGETLSKGYPRARGFADALMANVERNVPTTQELRNPEYMQQRALNYISPMAGAIKAYHGSPHEFDRFDMSKIGTGEGTQSYGFGHYLSENPQIAKNYTPQNGSIYEVNLKWPNQEQELKDPLSLSNFLDFNKPMGEQSPYIKNLLGIKESDQSVEDFMNMGAGYEPYEVSERLNDWGIPGVTFMNEGSDLGRNYVVFGDEYPQIVNRAGSLANLLKGKK